MPEAHVRKYEWPKGDAFLEAPKRPYERVGLVKTRVDYPTLTDKYDESYLCKNYFNKAALDLVKRARDAGGDAVMEVRSVILQLDGKFQTFSQAECVDEGAEGQVLAQGVAIRWKPEVEEPSSRKD